MADVIRTEAIMIDLTIEETTDLLSEKPDINRYHYSFYLLTEVY